MKIFLTTVSLFFIILISSCNNSPLTPSVTEEKIEWKQVDSVNGGYFPGPVAAGENNTFYYIHDNFLFRCTEGSKTLIPISYENSGAATIKVYNNNYIILGAYGVTNGQWILKAKILSHDSLSVITLDTIPDISPPEILVVAPGKFYIASKEHYYFVDNGSVSKFDLTGVNNVTGISKIGNTIFILAYNLGYGESIFRLGADNSPSLYENNQEFSETFTSDKNIIRARYADSLMLMDYLTEGGWVNFRRGNFQFFNMAAFDDLDYIYLISNTSKQGIEHHGNMWNGAQYFTDNNFPFTNGLGNVFYFGNMKNNTFYAAILDHGFRILRGRRVF
ncbi:MAG: hypothetical protein JST55_14800 [Bacteroidetes bacterium]|nr:hypothetical protein [Bacteroidota bacterium]